MFTVKYYDNCRTAKTPKAAIKLAGKMIDIYGRGNKPPVIECELKLMADMQNALDDAKVCYAIRVAS